MNIIRTLLHGIGVSISRHAGSLLLIPLILESFNLVIGCQRQKMILVIQFGNGCNGVGSDIVEITNQLIDGNTCGVTGFNNSGCHSLQRVTSHFTGGYQLVKC